MSWNEVNQIFFSVTSGRPYDTLPPGVYIPFVTDSGAHLRRVSDGFERGYQILPLHSSKEEEVKLVWNHTKGNLGVMLNGLRGTGKSSTMQSLANWAIEQGLPVISFKGPETAPEAILSMLNQDVCILFDEFEKNWKEKGDTSAPNSQAKLLSVIDGVESGNNRKLFLFSSNSLRLDENFRNRPSRIRLFFNFSSLTYEEWLPIFLDETKGLYEDLVPEIQEYLHSVEFVSIDIIRAIAQNCMIYKGGPALWKHSFNLDTRKPDYYQVLLEDGTGFEIDSYLYNQVRSGKDSDFYVSKGKNYYNIFFTALTNGVTGFSQGKEFKSISYSSSIAKILKMTMEERARLLLALAQDNYEKYAHLMSFIHRLQSGLNADGTFDDLDDTYFHMKLDEFESSLPSIVSSRLPVFPDLSGDPELNAFTVLLTFSNALEWAARQSQAGSYRIGESHLDFWNANMVFQSGTIAPVHLPKYNYLAL